MALTAARQNVHWRDADGSLSEETLQRGVCVRGGSKNTNKHDNKCIFLNEGHDLAVKSHWTYHEKKIKRKKEKNNSEIINHSLN